MKKLLAVLLVTGILTSSTCAFPVSAVNDDTVVSTVTSESTTGIFDFNYPDERIDWNGDFTFEGDQIVSDQFTVNSSSFTISAKATPRDDHSNKKYTIELYKSDGEWAQSLGKATFLADGEWHEHTFKDVPTDEDTTYKLYFIIKTKLFGAHYLYGEGEISNISGVYGKPGVIEEYRN